MLNLSQIESFYPENLRVNQRSLLREYLQYVLLEIIYRSDYGRSLVFMGGTAIHIVHGNQRFSEDLDFDNRGLSKENFFALVEEISHKLELLGYQVELSNKLNNTYRCLIKFPGIFHQFSLSGHIREKLIIQIDTEPQNFDYQADQVLISNFDILLKINTVPVDILLAQKLLAILKRARPMGRDFFDAIFLFSKTNPNYNYLKEKMGLRDYNDYPKIVKDLLFKKCSEIDFNKLITEIKPFLFQPDDAQRILLFPNFIAQKIH